MDANDQLEITKSIDQIRTLAESIKRSAEAMGCAASALKHLGKEPKPEKETGMQSVTIAGLVFDLRWRVASMQVAEQRLLDALSFYLGEMIRVKYEQIQELKDQI